MSQSQPKNVSPEVSDAEFQRGPVELSDQELDVVVGGLGPVGGWASADVVAGPVGGW
jgi:hypothetical protein